MGSIMEIRDLVVRYGPIQAISGVSMDIKEGQIVALLGANGAGKSTLIKCISGLVKPYSGMLIFQNKSINHLLIHQIAAEGIVSAPENRQIFKDLTVEENLRVGAYTLKKTTHIEKNAEGVELTVVKTAKQRIQENFDRVYRYFPVLLERRRQQASTLSGGEQQMLAIGRALMATPKLLLLDEPSLGLAPIIVKNIFEIIKQISKEGTTVLLVEQNAFQTLKISDYAYVMKLGTVVAEGTSQKLLKDETLISAYLGGK